MKNTEKEGGEGRVTPRAGLHLPQPSGEGNETVPSRGPGRKREAGWSKEKGRPSGGRGKS